MTIYYIFEPALQLSPTSWQMATVHVVKDTGKEIGNYRFTRLKTAEKNIVDIVDEVAREYELKQVWNGKEAQ